MKKLALNGKNGTFHQFMRTTLFHMLIVFDDHSYAGQVASLSSHYLRYGGRHFALPIIEWVIEIKSFVPLFSLLSRFLNVFRPDITWFHWRYSWDFVIGMGSRDIHIIALMSLVLWPSLISWRVNIPLFCIISSVRNWRCTDAWVWLKISSRHCCCVR